MKYWRKMRIEFLPEAEKRVKRALILEKIARKENLIVSDVEVDAEIRRAAAPGEQLCPLRPAGVDEPLDLVQLGLEGNRAHLGLGVERVAHLDPLGTLDDMTEDVVVDRRVNQRTRPRDAGLAGGREDSSDEANGDSDGAWSVLDA